MNKRVAIGGGSGAAAAAPSWSRWEDLSTDVLSLIVPMIPADEVLRTVPFVCSSWRDALEGPLCWADIDIEDWCRRVQSMVQVKSTVKVDAAVRKLVRRSGGTHRRLSAYRLGDTGFQFAVSSGRLLTVLEIVMSQVTDQMVERHAESLPNLTKLNISYCLQISSKGIEAFGNHCKSLLHLKRNMPPPMTGPNLSGGMASNIEEGEAYAIANTMPNLKYLELAYALFSDQGLDAILTKCGALESLDIRGCWNVMMQGDIDDKCGSIQRFIYPYDDEHDGYFSDSSVDGGDGDQAVIVDVDNNDDPAAISDVDWSDDEVEDVDWSDDEVEDAEGDDNDVDWSLWPSDGEEYSNNENHAAIRDLVSEDGRTIIDLDSSDDGD